MCSPLFVYLISGSNWFSQIRYTCPVYRVDITILQMVDAGLMHWRGSCTTWWTYFRNACNMSKCKTIYEETSLSLTRELLSDWRTQSTGAKITIKKVNLSYSSLIGFLLLRHCWSWLIVVNIAKMSIFLKQLPLQLLFYLTWNLHWFYRF